MTKTTMIWQVLSVILAGIAVRKEVPETKELLEDYILTSAMGMLAYSKEEIKEVLYKYDTTEYAEVMVGIYSKMELK